MTTEGLKSWIIIMAALVLVLVYLDVTSGGSLGFDFSRGAVRSSVITSAITLVAAWRWGGWTRS